MLTVDMLVALAFAFLGVVTAFDSSLTFHYVKYPRVFRRNEVACQVCYGEFDCLSMDSCSYNSAVTDVLKEKDGMKIVNDGLKSKVDSMMYDLVLEESLREYNECIPLISSHTNCNKENLCLGCKTCDCDETGHWSCRENSKCSNAHLDIDHRIITTVVESLKDVKPSRYKRSYDTESSTHILFDDIIGWIDTANPYDSNVINNHRVINDITAKPTVIVNTTVPYKIHSNDDNNLLLFDDILTNDNLNDFIQYSSSDMTYNNKHEDSHQFLKVLKNIEEGKDDKSPVDNPHLNLELLKDLKQYIASSYVNEPSNEQTNSINGVLTEIDDINPDKQTSDINSVGSVLKRYARNVNVTSKGNQTKTSVNQTKTLVNQTKTLANQKTKASTMTPSVDKNKKDKTHSEKEIQHIIDVVTVLISNERKEINHLNYVKESLLKLLEKYQSNSNLSDIVYTQNPDDNSRKSGNWRVNMLNFYMSNLKRDVKDTLRDIYAITKLKKLGVNSVAENVSNLKPLLYALTSYYMRTFRDHRQNGRAENVSNIDNRFLTNTTTPMSISSSQDKYDSVPKLQRRVFQPSGNDIYQIKLIKRALTRILVIIDNDRLSTNALSPLSSKIKDILKRIVDKQYVKSFDDTHPSSKDPNFNLTKLLTTLAEDWQKMSAELLTLNPADRLYHMKILHLSLSQGIEKVKDALATIQIGSSRRMNFIEEYVGKSLISDISNYLASIDKRILNFAVRSMASERLTPKRRDEQTGSIWNHIKNALSNSTNTFVKYVRGKLKPKSYIVNEKVRKRAEEVNKQKFLDVMKKWQHNFDAYRARNKRSIRQYPKRLNHIIPKYLRGIKSMKANAILNKLTKVENRGPATHHAAKTQTRKIYTLPPAHRSVGVRTPAPKRKHSTVPTTTHYLKVTPKKALELNTSVTKA